MPRPELITFPFDAKCPHCGIAFHFETSSDHGWQPSDVARCPKVRHSARTDRPARLTPTLALYIGTATAGILLLCVGLILLAFLTRKKGN